MPTKKRPHPSSRQGFVRVPSSAPPPMPPARDKYGRFAPRPGIHRNAKKKAK